MFCLEVTAQFTWPQGFIWPCLRVETVQLPVQKNSSIKDPALHFLQPLLFCLMVERSPVESPSVSCLLTLHVSGWLSIIVHQFQPSASNINKSSVMQSNCKVVWQWPQKFLSLIYLSHSPAHLQHLRSPLVGCGPWFGNQCCKSSTPCLHWLAKQKWLGI